jgi:dihydropteroate synthase
VESLEAASSLRTRSGDALPHPRRRLGARGRFSFATLDSPAILGVLNVTPDSFSDGGRFSTPAAAVSHARGMARAGAAIIDVGGESTRPGARPVAAEEELRRVLPVIAAIRRLRPISIDTTKADVAAQALRAGAGIVNDVSAATADPRMLGLVAERGAAIILMHRKGSPRTMDRMARYGDVVEEVKGFLAARVDAALRAGIRRGAIAVDPGIGFAKNLAHNLTLLAHLDEIAALGFPVVIGVSRKRFLGRLLGEPVAGRVEGTIAASLLAVAAGAKVVRVHDVGPMARALRVAGAIWGARRR